VDFVEGAGGYLETMALVDRAATLIHGDVMDVDPGRTFDVVCSVGLVEHFEGAQRRRLLLRHHELVAPGGYIVVVMPCFRGAQYLYHRVFDGPDLARHALDAMTPRTFDLFGELGVETLACGHVGRLRLWVAGPRPRGGRRRRVADAVGTMIRGVVNRLPVAPSGPGWSPYLLFVGCRAGARSAPPRG
jgi:SAM-dependent methyltransferase